MVSLILAVMPLFTFAVFATFGYNAINFCLGFDVLLLDYNAIIYGL